MTAEKKVPAIEKADKIFKYLYYKDSATQSEISKELNIPKATTNRLLAVLTELKYLSFEIKSINLERYFTFFQQNMKDIL